MEWEAEGHGRCLRLFCAREVLKKGMTRLKARERRAIELWAEGMSNRAIAADLNTTVGAVKMLLYRTVLKLRKMLNHYVGDEH